MVTRDWRQPQAYAATAELSAAQWAWEFLRRNPRYQHEWQTFAAVWDALEQAYGSPPDRDFSAWKADPRAWVPASDCRAGECRIDQDKVLIECALGARWGFYKFPPDPRDDDPVGGGRLVWRELDPEAVVVGADDRSWLGDDPSRVALGFDLSLPLRDQFDRAKRHLQLVQRRRQRQGLFEPLSIGAQGPALQVQLRLLDAEAAGADAAALAAISQDWVELLHQASCLRDGEYRRLAHLPA